VSAIKLPLIVLTMIALQVPARGRAETAPLVSHQEPKVPLQNIQKAK
jgi:hypothetical protein